MSPSKRPFVIDMPTPVTLSPDANVAARPLSSVLVIGLIAILIWSSLAFGTTEPWSQFIQRTAVLALVAIWAFIQFLKGSIEIPSNPILLPAAILMGFAVFQFVSGLTSYRYATLTESLNYITYGGLILLASDAFGHRRSLRKFVFVMSIFGFALALFAIVQGLSGTGKIYWLRSTAQISAAIYGPYANHNHYAGLMEMLIPLAGAAAVLEFGAKRLILLFATATMVLSVFFSRSRGGMIALAAAMLFICAVFFRSNRRKRGLLILGIFAAVVAFMVVWLGNDSILKRFSEVQDAYRLSIYKDSLRMWLHKPIIGFGLGTFSTVYPEFRSFSTNLFVNHAHNDYLELLTDTGLIGIALLGWFLFGTFRTGFLKLRETADYEGRILTLAVLTGIVAMLTHSLLDFNLHIPANAAFFYVLCAAAATPFKRRIHSVEPQVEQEEDSLPEAE